MKRTFSLPFAMPAASGDSTTTLALTRPAVLIGVTFTLTTDATVVTRTASCQILQNTVPLAFGTAAFTQAASLVRQYLFQNVPAASQTLIGATAGNLPSVPVEPNVAIRVMVNNYQAGDVISAGWVNFVEDVP